MTTPSLSLFRRARKATALAVTGALVVGLLAIGGSAVAATPAPTDTPTPAATETATPTPTPTPSDTATAAPSPSPSTTADPTASATPAPSASSSPTPAPTASASAAPATGQSAVRNSAQSRLLAASGIGTMAAGVPNTPTAVWTENFENVAGTAATSIADYASNAYTTDTYWRNSAQCNGVLTEYQTPDTSVASLCTASTSVGSRNNVRRLADVLGQVGNGYAGGAAIGSPANNSTSSTGPDGKPATQSNRSLTEWTESQPGAANETLLLRRVTALGVTDPSTNIARYYTLGLDMAEASCSFGAAAARAQITLGVLIAPSTAPISTSRTISPCTDAASRFYTSPLIAPATDWANGGTGVAAGSFVSDQPVKLTSAQLGNLRPEVRNLNVVSAGNDLAIDNLRVLDVTPSLDVAFNSGTVSSGLPSTLTFTITNTSDLYAKSDWSFTTALPSGVTIASTGHSGTCVDATGTPLNVTAAQGASSVAVLGGDLTAGMTSCTITVQVVAASAGTYTIDPPATTNSTLVAPSSTSMTVTAATTVTIQKNVVSRAVATDQFQLNLSTGGNVVATATTTGSATGIQTQKVGPVPVTRGSTYTVAETIQSGSSLSTYTTTYECKKGDTPIASGTETSGALTIPDEAGAQIVCTFTNTAQTGGKFYCDANYVYGLRADGTIVQGYAPTGGQALALPGAPTGVTTANSLAIDPGTSTLPNTNPTTAWAVVRGTTDLSTASSVIKYTVAAGTITSSLQAVTTSPPGTGTIVAGAVDAKGNYIIGKADASAFRLYRYNEATTSFVAIGFINTGAAARNGDFAFDAQGNLFVLQSVGGNQQTYAVTAANYNAALTTGGAATTIPSTSTTNKPSDQVGLVANGIAFSTRGIAYLSSATTIFQFDPMTWTTIAGAQTITGATGVGTNSLTDLASCAAPSTVSLDKQVLGRRTGGASDNFTISLSVAGGTVATASTTPAATPTNSASIAPLPVLVNSQVTISETMVNGTTDVSSSYQPVYECWANGVRITTGRVASAVITIPNTAGVGVACTYYNTPFAAATVTLRKAVSDALGANAQPAAGWRLSTQITSSTGAATLPTDPSNAANQSARRSDITTGADGSATFSVLFGSTTSTANITISELQQTGYGFLSLTCVGVSPNPTTTTSGTTTSAALSAAVTPGSTVDCTFTNRPIATVTLVKTVSSGSLAPSTWNLAATRSNVNALPGPTGATGTAGTTSIPVSAGVSYNLVESGGPATYQQVGNWQCLDANSQAVAVTAAGDVTFPRGASVTCRVTNATATITLIKSIAAGAPAAYLPSSFTLTATPATFAGLTATSVVGNAGGTAIEVRPGFSYTLSEATTTANSPRLWYQTVLQQCTDASATSCVTVGSAITTPAAGGTAFYRFINAQAPQIALPLTGGPASDAFLIAGAVVLVIAAGAAALRTWRRSRRSSA